MKSSLRLSVFKIKFVEALQEKKTKKTTSNKTNPAFTDGRGYLGKGFGNKFMMK